MRDIITDFLSPFDWDKSFYKFNRDEKDMNPYSVKREKGKMIITHNVVGLNKEDVKIYNKYENGSHYIQIEGKTKDEITDKEYSVNSRFVFDDTALDLSKATSTMKNGLLYITIPEKTKILSKDSLIKID